MNSFGAARDVRDPRALKTSEMDSRAVVLSSEQKNIEIGAWSSEIQLLKVFDVAIFMISIGFPKENFEELHLRAPCTDFIFFCSGESHTALLSISEVFMARG